MASRNSLALAAIALASSRGLSMDGKSVVRNASSSAPVRAGADFARRDLALAVEARQTRLIAQFALRIPAKLQIVGQDQVGQTRRGSVSIAQRLRRGPGWQPTSLHSIWPILTPAPLDDEVGRAAGNGLGLVDGADIVPTAKS